MRSKTFWLLVCLTSCVIYPVVPETYKNDKYFCKINSDNNAPVGIYRDDCKDKEINYDDLKWKLETAFNEQKEVPKITELFLTHDGDPTEAHASGSTTVINVDATTTFPYRLTVSPTKYVIIAVFDPECLLYAKQSDIRSKSPKILHHLFSGNIKTMDISSKEVLDKSCVANCNGNEERGLGNFIVSETLSPVERNLKISLLSPNLFFNYSIYSFAFEHKGGKVECYHQCQFGRVFEFKLKQGAGKSFANTTEPDMYTGTVPTLPPVPIHEYTEKEQSNSNSKIGYTIIFMIILILMMIEKFGDQLDKFYQFVLNGMLARFDSAVIFSAEAGIEVELDIPTQSPQSAQVPLVPVMEEGIDPTYECGACRSSRCIDHHCLE